jgi:NADH:ubiquinone reductase (non-electrogenic)
MVTDNNLRVKGSRGSIFALGDCATVERPRSLAKAEQLFREAAGCSPDGECPIELDKKAICAALMVGAAEFPHLEELSKNVNDDFSTFTAGEELMDFSQFRSLLEEEDKSLRSYPATAQVAKQQGEYLAKAFNDGKVFSSALDDKSTDFEYVNKGSLAYIGKDSAVADIPGFAVIKGFAAGLIWKSFETISQSSPRNIVLVASDMIRTKVFGRDISRIN